MPHSFTFLFLPPQRATFLGPLANLVNHHALNVGHVVVFTVITKDLGQAVGLDPLWLVI
jgi:hypothetical protein